MLIVDTAICTACFTYCLIDEEKSQKYEVIVVCTPCAMKHPLLEGKTFLDFWLGVENEGERTYMFGIPVDIDISDKCALQGTALDFIVRNIETYLPLLIDEEGEA